MKRPLATVIVVWAAFLPGAYVLSSSAIAEVTQHQMDVAQHGAQVMPFSLTATTHIFTKTADGGIQQVVTKHHDPKQVSLIRGHLAGIARQFSAGDFAAPEQIHGNDMPGLAVLRKAQPGELKIRYGDLPNGGEIVYRSDEPRLVAALHDWFDAQLSDHGHDAMAGHDPGMMNHHSMDASSAQ
ncbi:aspartate carbamoyltransferase [Paraburkholderia sp. HP33-1]|uniref:aspartate carbamoyltransferase n=1 Tax=Paraburkholderia sp. HP33-1 TaxID=2883243 RepID=UPI001F249CCC|nr:aspartate carbamoyltransferase [Paraburkholderia sp. HP33-1]